MRFYVYSILILISCSCTNAQSEIESISFNKFPIQKKIKATNWLKVNDAIPKGFLYESE